ncbi:MAG TPA: hypothetical protein VFN79_10790 [Steroidobacteraceae bacterium]|nr:hypothetical protein [Steroidobacteraceae bacterium]
MDPRPRPLPLKTADPGAAASVLPLADLPVEAPLDSVSSRNAATEEPIDPEKLLLASEHAPDSRAAAGTAPVHRPQPSAAPASPAAAAVPPTTRAAELMDRDFIERNQVVERYLSGRLPLKGATDFERFCGEHPELLDELGIPERVNAALRLLEAGGKPEPWAEPPKRFWHKPQIALGLLGTTLALALALTLVASGSAQKSRRIAALRQIATERPLEPAASTRDIQLLPSRDGASETPAIVVGGAREAQLADFRIDESRSPYQLFRIVIDRIDQGRVGIIDRLSKDSAGNLRIALNTTALGPGDYQLTIEGLNWQGHAQPDSWVTIGIRATP